MLLLGWDAADWKLAMPLLEAGRMPNLARLVERGVMGNLLTLDPPLSPVLWTSVATGKHGHRHGVLGFVEPRPDGRGVQPVTSHTRRCKALWNILGEHGLRSHVVNWYASHPAEAIDGIAVSNLFAAPRGARFEEWPLPAGSVHPPPLRDALAELRMHPSDVGAELLLHFVPEAARVDPRRDRRLAALAGHLARLHTVHAVGTELAARDDWDLLAVYFEAIDHVGHDFMEYRAPRMAHVSEADQQIYGEVVDRIYVHHDRLLGRYLELVGDDATVLLVSDHGFHGGSLRPPGSARVQDEPVSWHRDFGIVAAAGPGLRCDERIHGMTLLDVAPTVLALLGLSVARDLDGRVQTQFWRVPPTLEWVDSYEDGAGGEPKPLVAADLAASAAVLEQLSALGYLDTGSLDGEAAVRNARVSQFGTLARIHRSIGALSDAEAACREQLAAIETGPGDAVARKHALAVRFELASILAERGEHAEAEALIATLDAAGVDPDALLRLRGRLLLAQADPAGAARHFESVLARAAGDPQARFGLALCQLRLEAWADAEANLRALLERDPEADRALHLLGIACHHQRRYEDALAAQMQAVSLRHVNPRAHYYLGLSAAALGHLAWARRAFEVALELRPALVGARRALETLDRRTGGSLRPAGGSASTTATLAAPARSARGARRVVGPDAGSPVLVSGLPRAGTSLMMQMLAAGGLPALSDGVRAADPDNPRGYLEWEPVRRIAGHPDALAAARGKALKVVSALLAVLPRDAFRVLFMERDVREIHASQRAMLQRGGTAPVASAEELERHLAAVRAWLGRQSHLDVCFVSHAELIRQPAAVAARVRDFLGLDLDVEAMTAAVDPALHRQRARPGA